MKAASTLSAAGLATRVVSMPSTNVFDRQSAAYQAEVLGTLPMVAVEAGLMDGWYKYMVQAGVKGTVVGMRSFGESAPAGDLFKYFGITVDKVVEAANTLV